MMSTESVGIYDSGLGGLTVWLALKELISEDLIYYGDTKHVPYGDKTKEQILFYSYNIIDFLQQQGAKIIVAACNTSSALALPQLQSVLTTPVFGVIEPAVEKALSTTISNRIGLIATVATVESNSYQSLFQKFAPQIRVFAQKCPKLVPLIEAGILEGELVDNALHEYLDPLLEEKIDTLILGCTHYPFLLPAIKRILGEQVQIVDPAWQTAKNVKSWLEQHSKGASPRKVDGRRKEFWVSGNPEDFLRQASDFIGCTIETVHYHQPPEALGPNIDDLISKLSVIRGDD